MRLCPSFCHEGIRSFRYYWTEVLVGLTGGSHKWNKRLWETKNPFFLTEIEARSLIFFQSISTWNVRNILYFTLKITKSYINTERQLRFRISEVYFKIPLRLWVVCLFPPRFATHVSKLPSPQTSRWKVFWLCQILYWFWGHQTQADIISGRYCGITAESSIAGGTQVLKLNVLCLSQKNDFTIRIVSVDGRQIFRYLSPLTDAFRLNVHWAEQRLFLVLASQCYYVLLCSVLRR
jgi:hypothetical protein